MTLYFREYGKRTAANPPLLLLHGLFGSSANWMGIARQLADDHYIIVPDLRNHGRSAHDPDMSYTAIVNDLLVLMGELACAEVALIGHSMGGKACMYFALQYPQHVAGLVVVDMAPASYSHDFDEAFDAFASVDLKSIVDRRSAQMQLSTRLNSDTLASYLLQNLVRTASGWEWRLNIEALKEQSQLITEFDPPPASKPYAGKTTFIYGQQSDYVRPDHYPEIRRWFPGAGLIPIANAGHWVYFEQPEAFMMVLKNFLAGLRP